MQLPDALSRPSSPKQRYEILSDLHVDHTAFSDTTLVHICKETKSCMVLTTVYRLTQLMSYHKQTTPRIVHKYWNMFNKLISDYGLLFQGCKVIIPLALRKSFLHDPYEEQCRHHKVPAQRKNPHLLAQHQQWHWTLHQAVLHLHQAIIYPCHGAPDQQWCSPTTLGETQHRLHVLGWEKISNCHQLFLKCSLLFHISSTTANTVINCSPELFAIKGMPLRSVHWQQATLQLQSMVPLQKI